MNVFDFNVLPDPLPVPELQVPAGLLRLDLEPLPGDNEVGVDLHPARPSRFQTLRTG